MNWWYKLQLKAKDPAARRAAVERIPEADLPGLVETLMICLRDEDAQVRCAAARALGRVGDQALAVALIGALRDPSGPVRAAAAAGLGLLGDTGACAPLAELLRDPHSSVRTEAASALRKLGWKPASAGEQAAHDVAIGNTRAAIFAGEEAIPTLVAELNHDTSFVRRSIAEALEHVDDPRVIKPLLAAIGDPDPTVRVSIIHALSRVAHEPATAALLCRMLRDKDWCVRLAAAEVLGKRNQPADAPEFARLLKDSHFEVRLTAVQFLGRLQSAGQAPALVPMLRDSDSDVRQAAARALAECGGADVIQPLVLALGDVDSGVRHAAEAALEKIDSHWARSPAAQQAAPKLEASLNDRPAWVRAAAGQVLASLRAART